MKQNLIVMCGLQCSGKSTMAKQLAKEYNAVVISSDSLREHYPAFDNARIFHTVYMLMNVYLKNGTSVIIDATNTTLKSRRQLFAHLKIKDCNKICFVMTTKTDECIRRLNQRNLSNYPHKFGEEVILKYSKAYKEPTLDEGWNEIIKDNEFNKNN